jgi:hypothetical protein
MSNSLLRAIPKPMNLESQAATSLVLEIYSLAILFMSCKTIHHTSSSHGEPHDGCHHQELSGIFQTFSLLKKLEKLKLLELVDVMTWRSLFVSCDLIQNPPHFSHTSICLLYDLLMSLDGIVPDLLINEIFTRSFQKKMKEGKGKGKGTGGGDCLDEKESLREEDQQRRSSRYLDLSCCSLAHHGLIWYSNKFCDYQRRFAMTSTSIASPTLTPTPTPPRLTRSRSNSVPTLSHHSSSSSPSKASSTIWQRFKSRNAAAAATTTNIDTDRINLSDESIDEIFGLKSDPSASVFAFATRSFGDSSSFTSSSSSSSHGLNMNMTAQEVQSEEELKLQEALEITERNLDQKIKMWKQIKLPGDDKGDRPSSSYSAHSYF